jgi:hypothetical protein
MKIHFNQAHINEIKLGNNDFIIFFGQHGMAFDHSYEKWKEDYHELSKIEMPSISHPKQCINFGNNNCLVCVPDNFLSDEDLKKTMYTWLNYANLNNYSRFITNGVRGTVNLSTIKENNSNRVKFIVELIKEWYNINSNSKIMDIVLVSYDDDYIRNFPSKLIDLGSENI